MWTVVFRNFNPGCYVANISIRESNGETVTFVSKLLTPHLRKYGEFDVIRTNNIESRWEIPLIQDLKTIMAQYEYYRYGNWFFTKEYL